MMLSVVPIWIVDIVGSVSMIVLSFLSLYIAIRLRLNDRKNIIWVYLFWMCAAFLIFAVSRSAGHILKQILLFSDRNELWTAIQPYTGSINTLTFIVVGAVTLYFGQTWLIYLQIQNDKQTLQNTKEKLLFMNQNLENLVEERTQALALSERKYRRIFEASRDMILVTDTGGKILALNPAGKDMLKCCKAESDILNTSFASFFKDEVVWTRLIDEIKETGSVMSVEADIKRLNGEIMRALISAGLSRSTTPEEDTVYFLVKDIEQRRLMEQQMAQADKLASIGELSSGIAHEINNPLGIILGYTQLLRRNESAGSERHKDLTTIEKHVRSCKTIVEDLLNFARSSPPKKEIIDLHTVVDDVIAFIRQHSKVDHVEIVRYYNPDIPSVLLDKEKIRQVLINLIMNARYAVGGQGKITLSTELESAGDYVIINVVDTGHGIDPNIISRIFDPFFTTKPTGEGTGLGLSVSYGIIKNHGGEIVVKSTPGKGSTFKVFLPVSTDNHRIME